MSLFDILKSFLPLILIIGLLYAVLYFIKKNGISLGGKKSNLIKIEVLSTQSIMPKKYISVVRIQDKFLILGISDHSVSLLKEVENIELDELPALPGNKENFMDIFKKNIGMK
jgi:flagellar protein FliO/FliZ